MNTKIRRFKEQLDELLLELNSDIKNEPFNVGVFVFDIRKGEGQHFGIGCPGCMANAVLKAVETGEIKHVEKSMLHIDTMLNS